MATFRTTISSTLGTITTTADAITKTVGAAAIGVDMLHSWADAAQKEQQHRQAIEAKTAKARIEYEAARELKGILSEIHKMDADEKALMKSALDVIQGEGEFKITL